MILIVAAAGDVHIPFVTAKLDDRHADYVRFDPLDFPKDAELSFHYNRSGLTRRLLKSRQGEIDPDRVTAVWLRANVRIRPIADSTVSEEHKWWVAERSARSLAEFCECLDCLWLPNRPVADRDPYQMFETSYKVPFPEQPMHVAAPSGSNKLHQLTVAGRMGFALPRTLFTNSPEAFLRFYEECNGQVISKSPFKMRTTRNGEEVHSYTYGVQRRNVAAYRSIRHVPVIFQEKVPKKLELRVTVVGRKVFAAAIQSQENPRLSGDWRHYPEFDVSQYYSAYDLPPDVARRCADFTAELGLCFGALDLILTPEGEYVFLEINPHAQWTFIEMYTGLPIADAVADMLIRGSV